MTESHILDLSKPIHIHIVGVGGAGMNAIAAVLSAMGQTVTGSDLKDSAGLDRLRALGVQTWVGHDAAHIEGADIVAISTAIPAKNPEVVAATNAGVPILRRAEILAAISARAKTVAVAGTHGKTTASSMLALMLVEAGLEPSFIIGGDLHEIGSGAVWGDGDLFVVEADESDGTFLELGASHAIITNVEPDHLDYYGTFAALRTCFEDFANAVDGVRVICADDEHASALDIDGDVRSYGFSEGADFRICDFEAHRSGSRFTVTIDGQTSERIEVAIPGRHNALNATAGLAMALSLGVEMDSVKRALSRFAGVGRRFEFRGEKNGVTFVDDYAHLPTEVKAALNAASEGGWGRVVAVFQPHRYSRTANHWQEFAEAFGDADHVVFMDIYSAGESSVPGITGHLIADAVLKAAPESSSHYCEDLLTAEQYLASFLKPGDLCITLGAGDVTLLADRVIDAIGDEDG